MWNETKKRPLQLGDVLTCSTSSTYWTDLFSYPFGLCIFKGS